MREPTHELDRPHAIKDAAPLIPVSESGLRKMIAAGVVPAFRVGLRRGHLRVIPSEVITFLKARGR